jgi:hypothetical protein
MGARIVLSTPAVMPGASRPTALRGSARAVTVAPCALSRE